MVFRLLQGNAEQEQNLLRLGANKLVCPFFPCLSAPANSQGDTDKSVASKTSHLLLSLLQVHPAMKSIIARDVSALVLKPVAPTSAAAGAPGSHVRFDDVKPTPKSAAAKADKSDTQSHARYYGLITLNQITLARGDQELAGKLVDLYFEIFREILGEENGKDEAEEGIEKVTGKVGKWEGRRKKAGGKKGKGKGDDKEGEEMEAADARLVAAVLTGINRAVPYAKLDDAV